MAPWVVSLFGGWMALGWPHLVVTWFKDSWDVRDILAMNGSSCGRTDWAYSFGSSSGITKEADGDTSVHKGYLLVSCLLKPGWSKSGGQPGVCVGGLYQRVWVEGGGNFYFCS